MRSVKIPTGIVVVSVKSLKFDSETLSRLNGLKFCRATFFGHKLRIVCTGLKNGGEEKPSSLSSGQSPPIN